MHLSTFAELSAEIVTKYGTTSSILFLILILILILIYRDALCNNCPVFLQFLIEFSHFVSIDSRLFLWQRFDLISHPFRFVTFRIVFLVFRLCVFTQHTIFTYRNRALSLEEPRNAFLSNWKLTRQMRNECRKRGRENRREIRIKNSIYYMNRLIMQHAYQFKKFWGSKCLFAEREQHFVFICTYLSIYFINNT